MTTFARRIELSYTYAREIERGSRLPSDKVIQRIADRLAVPTGPLVLDANLDRSPLLAKCLTDVCAELYRLLEAAHTARQRPLSPPLRVGHQQIEGTSHD